MKSLVAQFVEGGRTKEGQGFESHMDQLSRSFKITEGKMNFQVSSKKDSVLIVRPVLQLFAFN